MTKIAICFYLVCTLFVACDASATTLKYSPPMAKKDTQKSYFVTLLKRACENAVNLGMACETSPVPVVMFQQRQLKSLDDSLIDVMWTVTSIQREQDFLPIRIPLTKGLIGYRVAVFHSDNASSFAIDSTLAEIKKLQHVQGHDWPDTEILRFNGFKVSTTSWYSSLYKALDDHHYDVLLRGALEVTSEYALYPTQHLSIDTNHAFYYPSAIYFFVSKSRPELATMLTKSLRFMQASGEFDRLLLEFGPHAKALAQLSLNRRKLHILENPLLPSETPLNDHQSWFVNSLLLTPKSATK